MTIATVWKYSQNMKTLNLEEVEELKKETKLDHDEFWFGMCWLRFNSFVDSQLQYVDNTGKLYLVYTPCFGEIQ
jgi:hypothetical protein